MSLVDFRINEERQKEIEEFHKEQNTRKLDSEFSPIQCNICSYTSNFEFLTENDNENELCPNCYSKKESRSLWYYLTEYTEFLKRNDVKILHFSAENSTYKILKSKIKKNYIASNIKKTEYTDEVIDVQDIEYPDNTFNLIIASHILEYATNDKKALEEFYRVLKPNGELIIQANYVQDLEKTFEINQISTPELRERYYENRDIYRVYGEDLFDKMEDVGFKTKREMAWEILHEPITLNEYVVSTKPLFIGTKH